MVEVCCRVKFEPLLVFVSNPIPARLCSGSAHAMAVGRQQLAFGAQSRSSNKPNAQIEGGRTANGGWSENEERYPMTNGRAWLKNGTPVGDLLAAPRCGAKNRRGTPCQCPAMRNGRCRLHGGLSTGAKTAEGLERIRRAVTKHGYYTKEARLERMSQRRLLKDIRE